MPQTQEAGKNPPQTRRILAPRAREARSAPTCVTPAPLPRCRRFASGRPPRGDSRPAQNPAAAPPRAASGQLRAVPRLWPRGLKGMRAPFKTACRRPCACPCRCPRSAGAGRRREPGGSPPGFCTPRRAPAAPPQPPPKRYHARAAGGKGRAKRRARKSCLASFCGLPCRARRPCALGAGVVHVRGRVSAPAARGGVFLAAGQGCAPQWGAPP